MDGIFNVSNIEIRRCSNMSDAQKTSNAITLELTKTPIGSKSIQECEPQCQATEFHANIQRVRMKRSDKKTYIGVIYQTNTVTLNEESLVYDILNFIGTVGGSLGLFIGFSFYDFCRLVEKQCYRKLKKQGEDCKKEEIMEMA